MATARRRMTAAGERARTAADRSTRALFGMTARQQPGSPPAATRARSRADDETAMGVPFDRLAPTVITLPDGTTVTRVGQAYQGGGHGAPGAGDNAPGDPSGQGGMGGGGGEAPGPEDPSEGFTGSGGLADAPTRGGPTGASPAGGGSWADEPRLTSPTQPDVLAGSRPAMQALGRTLAKDARDRAQAANDPIGFVGGVLGKAFAAALDKAADVRFDRTMEGLRTDPRGTLESLIEGERPAEMSPGGDRGEPEGSGLEDTLPGEDEETPAPAAADPARPYVNRILEAWGHPPLPDPEEQAGMSQARRAPGERDYERRRVHDARMGHRAAPLRVPGALA